MKNFIPMKSLALAAGLALTVAAPVSAKPPSIVVSHPWIALPPAGAPTAAGYVTLRNDGPTTDTLLSAATPSADKLELHSMSMAGGIMRMRPVTGGTPIAPGKALTLAPGGDYHFMVVRPRRPLKAGALVPATLTFSKAGTVKAVFVVEAPPGAAPMR